MAQQRSRYFGDLERLHRWRWVWTVAAILFLVAGLVEIILGGSLLHVVLGALFLIMSALWGTQAWAGFRYRPELSLDTVAAEEQTPRWEALGLGDTPEEDPPKEGTDR
jgi:hypothetical protein